MMPPWPGMMSPKSLILNALLKPEAKKPPKGPMMEAKRERKKVWTKKGKKVTVSFICNNRRHVANVCMQRKVNKAPKIRIQDLTMGEMVLCLNLKLWHLRKGVLLLAEESGRLTGHCHPLELTWSRRRA